MPSQVRSKVRAVAAVAPTIIAVPAPRRSRAPGLNAFLDALRWQRRARFDTGRGSTSPKRGGRKAKEASEFPLRFGRQRTLPGCNNYLMLGTLSPPGKPSSEPYGASYVVELVEFQVEIRPQRS